MGMRIAQDDLWLCDDCTIYAVNGDTSGIEDEEREKEVVEGVDALGPHLVADYDSDTGEGVYEFSRMQCTACGTRLGGSRSRFAILEESDVDLTRSRQLAEVLSDAFQELGADTNIGKMRRDAEGQVLRVEMLLLDSLAVIDVRVRPVMKPTLVVLEEEPEGFVENLVKSAGLSREVTVETL